MLNLLRKIIDFEYDSLQRWINQAKLNNLLLIFVWDTDSRCTVPYFTSETLNSTEFYYNITSGKRQYRYKTHDYRKKEENETELIK